MKGTTNTNAGLLPPRTLTWSVPFEESTRDASINGNESLPPGAYRDLEVRPNATLHLAAGTYTFRSLRIFPNAVLTADLGADPLLVYVSDDVDLKGAVAPTGHGDRMFLGYAGTGTVNVKAPFQGTIIAPSGTLSFEPSVTQRGSFFARTITSQPRAIVTFEPFAAWEFLAPPKPIIDCVAHFTSTQSNALWSYENPLDVTVTIPVGPRNHMVPAEATPITTFEPGHHDGVFWSEFHGGETTWSLGGQTASSDASSRRCVSADLPPPTASTTPEVVGEGASQAWPGLADSVPPDVRVGVSHGPLNGATARASKGPLTFGPLVRTPPSFGPTEFQFIVESQKIANDASCGPHRLIVENLSVNGVAFGDHELPDCAGDGSNCDLFYIGYTSSTAVPSTQATVTIHADIVEDDTLPCGGSDDHLMTLDLVINNVTGASGGGYTTAANDSVFLSPTDRCASFDGNSICWRVVPTGSPRVCTAWKALFVDAEDRPEFGFSGHEDVAVSNVSQDIPASFAVAQLMTKAGTTTVTNVVVLDKDGCVPQGFVPPGMFWSVSPFSAPQTIELRVASNHCLDRNGDDCSITPTGDTSTGTRFIVEDGKVKIPRFRGHPEWREDAQGVSDGEANSETSSAKIHAGIQGGSGASLQDWRPLGSAGRARPRPD